MACRAHVVACMPCQAHVLERHCSQTNYHKSCQAQIGWFFKQLLGALSSPCRGMSSPCQGMSNPSCGMPFAHICGISSHILACLVKPMSWGAMSRHVEPVSRHVEPVSRHVEPVSRHVKPLLWHAFCPYCGISSHILACLVKPMSWGALSSPCRGMPFQAHVVWLACLVPMSWHALSSILASVLSISWHATSGPFHGMPCVARWHALSCFQRFPGDKHKSCHVLPSPVPSTCRDMPCHVSSDCPVTSTSRAMPCLA
jgi:hypothetical protein